MTMSFPIDLAHRVANGDFDAEVTAWLSSAFRCWLSGDAPLAAALRLTGGQRIAARNCSLRAAADALEIPDSDGSTWARACSLHAVAERFYARKLPMLARGAEVELSKAESHLLAAHQTGAKPLSSARRLYDVLIGGH